MAKPVLVGGGGVELGAGGLVERTGVIDQQRRFRGVLADLQPVLDQHAERRAPVADMVLPDDGVAEGLEHLDEAVPHHRGAQVADVHFLGDVRGGIVDDDALGDPPPAAGRGRLEDSALSSSSIQVPSKVRLMKPGPEISTAVQMPSRSRASTILAAASRGGMPAFLASAMAALIWMSANCEGRTTGSVPRYSSPNALAIAAWTLGTTNSAGLFHCSNYQFRPRPDAREHPSPNTPLPPEATRGQIPPIQGPHMGRM